MLAACHGKNNNNVPSNVNGAYMYFNEDTYDAGKVTEGDTVTHIYTVENRGKADLLLKSVSPSCGCTIANYEKNPIAPGKSASIKVAFHSIGRAGTQHKQITVVSNADPDTKVLHLQCEVVPNNKTKK